MLLWDDGVNIIPHKTRTRKRVFRLCRQLQMIYFLIFLYKPVGCCYKMNYWCNVCCLQSECLISTNIISQSLQPQCSCLSSLSLCFIFDCLQGHSLVNILKPEKLSSNSWLLPPHSPLFLCIWRLLSECFNNFVWHQCHW